MKEKKDSWRHHYIPVFYLINFTGEDGHFFVFDKEMNVFPSNPRRSPRQVCFEPDRNTLIWEDKEIRHTGLEDKTYQYFDSKMAKTFAELNNSTLETFKWRDELVGNLEHFISMLFWRLPANDERFDQMVQNSKSIEDFGIVAIDEKTGEKVTDESLHQLYLQDKNFQKALKPVLSYTSMLGKLPEFLDDLEWKIIYWNGNNPRLTSDNPLLFKHDVSNPKDVFNKIILPLSSNKSLIKFRKGFGKDANPYSAFFQDMAVFHFAKKYVICRDQNYLAFVAEKYALLDRNDLTNRILPRLFESFNEFNENQ